MFFTASAVAHAEPVSTSTWQNTARQIVYVVSDQWKSPVGTLLAFERSPSGWKPVLEKIPVTLGRNGVGVGLGLHDPNQAGPEKREGDKRAPAGIFPLEFSFGTKGVFSVGKSSFPYRKTGATHFWVDDPASRYYNQWIDTADRSVRKDWNSAEVLRRKDGIYDLVLVVGHNRGRVVPGRGSAIFLHRWFRPGVSTIGCTAMDPEHLKALWQWLDVGSFPILVQGPREFVRGLPLPSGETSSIKAFLHP